MGLARAGRPSIHGRIVARSALSTSLGERLVSAGDPSLDLAGEAADLANVALAETQFGRPWARSRSRELACLAAEHQSFDQWLHVLRVNLAAPMG
jgi:hypothetical protein